LSLKSFKKSLKKHFKSILNDIKYGDTHRLPLAYLPTYTNHLPSLYTLPMESKQEPFSSYQTFPELSKEVLIELFATIGVEYVPEICLYYLKEKTPFEVFENFCLTFALEDEVINGYRLNEVVTRLHKMDQYRTLYPFNSKPIYTALIRYEFMKADRLIEQLALSEKNFKTWTEKNPIEEGLKTFLLERWESINIEKQLKNS